MLCYTGLRVAAATQEWFSSMKSGNGGRKRVSTCMHTGCSSWDSEKGDGQIVTYTSQLAVSDPLCVSLCPELVVTL